MPINHVNTSSPASFHNATLQNQPGPERAKSAETPQAAEPGSQGIYAKSVGATTAAGIRGNVGKVATPESIAKTWMSKEIFLSKEFPKQNIGQFVASQFNIPADQVEQHLYTLPCRRKSRHRTRMHSFKEE
ncbi:MAG: hypothetical protein ACRYGK_04795 [Janthinobacterium lividum]